MCCMYCCRTRLSPAPSYRRPLAVGAREGRPRRLAGAQYLPLPLSLSLHSQQLGNEHPTAAAAAMCCHSTSQQLLPHHSTPTPPPYCTAAALLLRRRHRHARRRQQRVHVAHAPSGVQRALGGQRGQARKHQPQLRQRGRRRGRTYSVNIVRFCASVKCKTQVRVPCPCMCDTGEKGNMCLGAWPGRRRGVGVASLPAAAAAARGMHSRGTSCTRAVPVPCAHTVPSATHLRPTCA